MTNDENRTPAAENNADLPDGSYFEHKARQEEQERQLRYVIKRMEKALERAEEKQKQDAKLFLSLGLLGGLCIFLLCL